MTPTAQNGPNILRTLLVVLIGQVRCLTLVVILASVFAGMWLDNMFGTKPVITLVLLFAGIPISVLLMLFVSRRTLAKLKSQSESSISNSD